MMIIIVGGQRSGLRIALSTSVVVVAVFAALFSLNSTQMCARGHTVKSISH